MTSDVFGLLDFHRFWNDNHSYSCSEQLLDLLFFISIACFTFLFARLIMRHGEFSKALGIASYVFCISALLSLIARIFVIIYKKKFGCYIAISLYILILVDKRLPLHHCR